MKGTILLNYNENTRQVEEEEKARFLREILIQSFENTEVAFQIQNIWGSDGVLSTDQKVKLRGILTTYGIQIHDDLDGHLDVYIEDERVAEWRKPTYILKQDLGQRDRKKRLYLEMHIEYSSIFEESNEQEENN